MTDLTPTRSLLIALADERRTMREGYAFLDEKCLLLAGEMLRQVRLHETMAAELAVVQKSALEALVAALARHGLQGLQVYPPGESRHRVRVAPRPLLGVMTVSAQAVGESGIAMPAVNPSPEVKALRAAQLEVAIRLTSLAAVSVSLARLLAEYRKTVRRVRALQDVLLPELDADIADIDARLDDMEREEAIALRTRR
jgi:V/A-type H+-transporting ATPase subunit D